MAQKRILIIEDNPVNMELATDLLEAADYVVTGADNAEDGVRVAQAQMPDLVLMDIALPGMDGLTATGILKKNPRTAMIPVVALTAHAMKGDEEKALAAGCLGYITKPINTRSFSRLVSEFAEMEPLAPAMIDLEPVAAAQAEAFLGTPVQTGFAPPPVVELAKPALPQPHALEPVSLEPVSLEPMSLEPVMLEPVSLEPVPLEPVVAQAPPVPPVQAPPKTERPTAWPSVPAIIESPQPVRLPAGARGENGNGNGANRAASLVFSRKGKNGKAREQVALIAEKAARILVVDDDEFNREVLTGMLRSLGHETATASDGFEALNLLDDSFDLVLLDVMMPGMDGVETCRRIRDDKKMTVLPVVMVTALSSRDDQLRAVEAGADDWITKPVDRRELTVRVQSHLKFKAAQDALKRQQRDLEATVKAKTADLRRVLEQVTHEQQKAQEAYQDTMHRLALAAEFRDGFMAAAHIRCVGNYCAAIARGLNLPESVADTLLHAAPIHDIGILAVPEEVVRKGEDRSIDEEEQYRDHTTLGARLLSGASSDLLRAAEAIALSHHERWDGSGFPYGRRGEDIPLYGRICAVADFFDTLTAYNGEFQVTNEEAREVMLAGRGTDFDPAVIDAFFDRWDEILMFQRRFRRTEAPPADLIKRAYTGVAVRA